MSLEPNITIWHENGRIFVTDLPEIEVCHRCRIVAIPRNPVTGEVPNMDYALWNGKIMPHYSNCREGW